MDKKQKKRVRKYISWILLAALVVLLATMPMMAGDNQNTDEIKASILSGRVQKATIESQLLGGGKLASEDAVEITVPKEVKLTGYAVGNGDVVDQGDLIATVDRVTVMTAITQVQDTLEELQKEIEDIRSEEAPDKVKTQAQGTVKAVYAQKGDNVQDVMLRHGALAVLSLDDKMAVQVVCDTDRKTGDDVTLTMPDGTQRKGEVQTNRDGILTVTFDDKGDAEGTEVTVESFGKGSIYIHSRYDIIAYSGTVSSVKVEAGDSVDAGDTLFRLEDTGHTARYYQLTSQHREYEELMLELFTMYQSQTITAPTSGVVTGVDEDGAYMLSHTGRGYTLSRLANAPNGDDESSYINYVGKVFQVGIDGLIVHINPQILEITDYMDLSGVNLDTALMTEEVTYTDQAPIYELQEGQWVQIEQAAIAAEDILLFAGDEEGNFVWLVRVQAAETEPPVEPGPEEPTEPTDPVLPDYPSYPDFPNFPSFPDMDFSGIYGNMYGDAFGGMGGMPQQEEDTYSLDTVTVASVTSQEEMTLSITVDELDISKIYPGQVADIVVDALKGEHFTAAVTRVSSAGESLGGNSKFSVELTLQKSGDMLPGMTASAFFTLDTARDVLCVPAAALTEQGTQTILYTGYDGENEVFINPVTVTTGVSDGENVQILSGVQEGDPFYYAYYDTLVVSNIPDLNDYDFF